MPEKKLQKEQSKVTVFDAKGHTRTVIANRFDLDKLTAKLGFETNEEFIKNNIHLLLFFGNRREIVFSHAIKEEPKKEGHKPLSPEDIERAFSILLRAIALAAGVLAQTELR